MEGWLNEGLIRSSSSEYESPIVMVQRSKLFDDYCGEESIQHLQIATGVPRGNEQVERIHRTLIPVLTKLSLDNSMKCQAQWCRWFKKFQNSDFDARNEECGRPAKKFEDAELQELLNEDDGQTQEHLAKQKNVDQSTVSRRLNAIGKIVKPSKSTARPNRFGRKAMLCIFRDQERPIYYELLKPGETINTDRYKQQLFNLNDAILEKREQYKKWKHKVIFLDDNAPGHRAKSTKDIVKALGWEL
ncbi:mariner Mos1 transposase [Trichonephila clavipes]|nr:mariner Mos1 transposase [Trichonephila clavipes]